MDRSVFPAEEGSLESPRRQERRRGRVDYARTPRERLRDREVLQPVLEQHIIPRLMNAHRSSLTPPPSDGAAAPSDVAIDTVHVQTLVDMALNGEGHKARDFVIRLRDQGASIETLYLDLLTPAARRIGVLWETDSCDFVLVTLALLRIQQVMYDLSPDFLSNGATPSSRRVVVVPVPGSQHTFGAAMVADFFRREGWDVVSHHDLSRADLVRMVRKEWFDVVALSISSPNQLISTNTLVADIRKFSSNRGILIMAGGPLLQSVPDLAARVGADVVALDAREAVDAAGRAVPVRGASVAN